MSVLLPELLDLKKMRKAADVPLESQGFTIIYSRLLSNAECFRILQTCVLYMTMGGTETQYKKKNRSNN